MAKLVKAPSTALSMAPAVLVTAGTMESSDVTTLAWVGTLCSEPPMIGIGVRPERWLHHFIVEGGAFVVNVADTAHARELDFCGNVSGKDTDKWELSALTREQGTATAVPLVAECPLNIECVVRQTLHLGSHDLFIGEVVAVHMDERVQKGGRALDPVCYVSGQYWKLGDLIGPMGFSRK
ncbi:flavin reductase family protein [Candidatus Cryosericum septentrionale]|jgi:flavin reductase (DIM6/NTAB) family NADH-FMN oxidoreductase RutF|uniref:Flavin reductase family protein n=1 Tax=Candidatus Cryosericum septentrionale TaxID=2290913 RepID=A0A398E443_9BACT|nr:flavin reductase family protein [Candidatus Cryosericum septentrionale]RIE17391.1 flavin reductase family protein [Candidatus Cryosericum septentrionale]